MKEGTKVAITGGCGFIGSKLAEELSRDYEVIVIDDLSSGKLENIKGLDVKFVKGSITDLRLLRRNFEDVECVFHQAATVSVQESIRNPLGVNEINASGTLKVLMAARDAGVEKVIYASSCAVYGDSKELPLSEDVKPEPKSPYAVSKLTGEYYCRIFSDTYGMKTTILRYFNVYGPGQDFSSDYAAVIPRFIHAALNGEYLEVYGDGNQTRDFIYVRDVVRANLQAMEAKTNGIFNVCTGVAVSINELASLILNLTESDSQKIYLNPRPGDIRHSVGDAEKARRYLGFQAKYSIEEGLRETIEWFRSLR
jgi:UDP-glucose 4-epimerase